MGKNDKAYGFEHKFREDWMKTFPNSLCFKIPNQMSGFCNVNNYSDYLCFDSTKLYFIDCKVKSGASFPFSDFPQLDRLLSLKHIPNIVTGIALWLYDKDRVFFIPSISISKMEKDGLKSFNPDKVSKNKYYYLDIPSIKLRTYMNSDYKEIVNTPNSEELEKWGENS